MGRYWFMTVSNNAYVFFVSLFLVHCSLVAMQPVDQNYQPVLDLAAKHANEYIALAQVYSNNNSLLMHKNYIEFHEKNSKSMLKEIRSNYDHYFASKRFAISFVVSSLVGGLIGGLYYAFGLRVPVSVSQCRSKDFGSLVAILGASLVSYGLGSYASSSAQPYLARRELKKAAQSGDADSFRMLERLGYVKPEAEDQISLNRALEEQRQQEYQKAHCSVNKKI